MPPIVSICIPAYNQLTAFEQLLKSIELQSFKDFELIITDDSDHENLLPVLEAFSFPGKVIYHKNDTPLGTPKNWNKALSLATGTYIKIMHHDDSFSQESSLSEMVKILDSDSECDFLFCDCNNISPDGTLLFKHSISLNEDKILKKNAMYLFYSNVIGAPSVTLFRKNDFKFDENLKFLVDIEFYIRILSKNEKYLHISQGLINIGHSENQVTSHIMKDKSIVLWEHFYLFNKLFHSKTNFKYFFQKYWVLIDNEKITSISKIEAIWKSEIPRFIVSIIKFRTILGTSKYIKRILKNPLRFLTYIYSINFDYYKTSRRIR